MLGDVAGFATAFAVLLGVVQLDQARRQRRSQFEEFFTRRYSDLLGTMSLQAQRGEVSNSEEDRRIAHAYFRLSDEQIFQAVKERRVSARAWSTWRDGITTTMQREPFKSEWEANVPPLLKVQLFDALRRFQEGELHDYPSLLEHGIGRLLGARGHVRR